MHYGNIEKNTVASTDGKGAGVYVGTEVGLLTAEDNGGVFIMSGGVIKGNAIWPGESKQYGGGKGVGVYVESLGMFRTTARGTIYGLGGFNELTNEADWEVTENQNYYRYQIHRVSLTYDDYESTPGGREVGYAVYCDKAEDEDPEFALWRNRTIVNEEFDTEGAGIWDNP
jgi:hypothetical protein